MNDSTAAAVTWATVAAQRALLAGELDRLTADQWNEPSLCQGWQVRHVVAHLIGEATTSRTRAVVGSAQEQRDHLRLAARPQPPHVQHLLRAIADRAAPAVPAPGQAPSPEPIQASPAIRHDVKSPADESVTTKRFGAGGSQISLGFRLSGEHGEDLEGTEPRGELPGCL